MIGGFASMASARICDSMLPKLAQDFNVPITSTSQVISSFALAYGLSQLVYGPLADRFGKLRVIFFAAVAASIGALVCALANNLSLLTWARFFAGSTAAGVIPLAIAWVGDSVDYQHRQAVMAKLLVGTVSGLIIGPLVGGFASDTIGWRSGFLVLTVMYLACAARLYPHAMAKQARPHTSTQNSAVLRGYLDVIRQPLASFVLPAVFLEGMLVFAALAFIPSYLHVREHISLFAASLAIACFGLGGLLYAWRSQAWLKKLGETGFSRWGSALFGAGIVALAISSSLPIAFLGSFAAGVGFYMLHNTLQTLGSQIHPQARGSAMALFAFILFAGQTVGVMGSAALVAQIGYTSVFALAAFGLPALGWWISNRLKAVGSAG
jgi:MFS transporter, YNFM family, putative membrane transport protein